MECIYNVKCSKCNESLPLDNFYKDGRCKSRTKYRTICKLCLSAQFKYDYKNKNLKTFRCKKCSKKFSVNSNYASNAIFCTKKCHAAHKSILDYSKSFLTPKLQSYIDGLMLSDITIRKDGGFQWNLKYEEFAQYIAKQFSVYAPYVRKTGDNIYTGRTRTHPDIKQERERWYPNGTKIVPRDVVITPESILMLYLGDGCLHKRDLNIILCTLGFSQEDNQFLVDQMFYEFGIESRVIRVKVNSKEMFQIYIPRFEVGKFLQTIGGTSPIVCYNYKFNFPGVKGIEKKVQTMTMKKTNTCLLRLSDQENAQLEYKSKLFGLTKSKLLREGALAYWLDDYDANHLLKTYQEGDDETKQSVVNVIMEYFRRKGYPHNKLSSEQLQKEMRKISNTKSPLLENDHLQTNTVGLALANHFHPHMVKVKCLSNYRTAYDQFADDDLFRDAINRWMELDKKPDPSGLRRILRTRNGVRSVVNFKPAISKFFYDTYCSDGDKILDPCAGYSGRLAGCISTNKNLQYHGIDPDGRTAVGGIKMASFFSRKYDSFDNREWNFGFKFDLGCAEDVMLELPSDSYSLCFTSPPYWGTEQYSTDPNQSYLRYPAYSEWRDRFLFVLLSESQRVIVEGGYIIFNVKDYKNAPIATDLCNMGENLGLELVKTYHMRLANSEYHRKDGEAMYHTEPIFVFKSGDQR